MYLKRTSRPRSVTTANGSILSHSDLPHEDTIRWVASRKAKVVRAVLYGLITEEDALTRYNISLDKFHSWLLAIHDHGEIELKAPLIQHFRQLKGEIS